MFLSKILGMPYECYFRQKCGCYKRLLLERIIILNPCLIRDRLAVIYKCFTCANILYVSVQSETVYCCIRSFLLAKPLFKLVYSWLIYLMCVSETLMSWITLEFYSFVGLEVSYVFCKVPTSLWSLFDV